MCSLLTGRKQTADGNIVTEQHTRMHSETLISDATAYLGSCSKCVHLGGELGSSNEDPI